MKIYPGVALDGDELTELRQGPLLNFSMTTIEDNRNNTNRVSQRDTKDLKSLVVKSKRRNIFL